MITNNFTILINSSLLVINAILLISVVVRSPKARFDYAYILACLCIAGWQVFEILEHFITNADLVAFLFTGKIAFVVVIPTLFFWLIALFYNIEKLIPLWLKIVFSAITFFFVFLALTNNSHELVRANVVVETTASLTTTLFTATPLYYFIMAFTQIPILGIGIIALSQRRKLPEAYRPAVTLLLWCLIIYALGFIIQFVGIPELRGLNFHLIGVTLANLLFYIAVAGNVRTDYLNVWSGDVYNYLDEAILIMNDETVIVDGNQAAQALFGSLNISVENTPIDTLWAQVESSQKSFVRYLEDEDHAVVSSDLYIVDGQHPVIYEIQYASLKGGTRAGADEYLILNEVTRNRLLIERLRDLVGVDALTGLPNRYSYERLLLEWDIAENLPLSIIMGDVNGLKTLNDEKGHQAGDELLKKAAELLLKNSPDEGVVARIGGDEFVMLLRNHDEAQAKERIEAITKDLSGLSGFPYMLSIALGSATKYHVDENLNALGIKADALMYADKKKAEIC